MRIWSWTKLPLAHTTTGSVKFGVPSAAVVCFYFFFALFEPTCLLPFRSVALLILSYATISSGKYGIPSSTSLKCDVFYLLHPKTLILESQDSVFGG
jgi:hypothetical protein